MISVFCFDSVDAIAIGFVLSTWLDALLIICAAKYCGGPGAISYLKITWKTYCSGLVMFLIVLWFNKLNFPLIPKLGLQILSGVFIYASVSFMIGEKAAADIYEQAQKVIGLKK